MTSLNPLNSRRIEKIVLLVPLSSVKHLTYFRGIRVPEVERGSQAHRDNVVTASIYKVEIKIINEIRGIQHLLSNLRQISCFLWLELVGGSNVVNLFELLSNCLWLYVDIPVLEDFLGFWLVLLIVVGFLTIKHCFDKKFLELALVVIGVPLLVNH